MDCDSYLWEMLFSKSTWLRFVTSIFHVQHRVLNISELYIFDFQIRRVGNDLEIMNIWNHNEAEL